MTKPILLFGYGNLSRGDDALGILLLEQIERSANLGLHSIDILSDFQLQIEHALDLDERALVLFIDASVAHINAFAFHELTPQKDKSYTTHAMSPDSVLAVYQDIKKKNPPPCFLLSIKGESFELGEGLSDNAKEHLKLATEFAEQLLNNATLNNWRQLITL
ncbi:MAG: hydrogenase maturation protease [Methylococcaceae bacterium]